MPTFVLSKYKPQETPSTPVKPESKQEVRSKKLDKILLKVDGSISEIVAKSLYELLGNTVKVEEVDVGNVKAEEGAGQAKAITTESINRDPASVFESVPKGCILYISNEGFKTDKEEWFLSNIRNKTDKVFYTVKSLARYCMENLADPISTEEGEGAPEVSESEMEANIMNSAKAASGGEVATSVESLEVSEELVVSIARICHEANLAYLKMESPKDEPHWEELDEGMRESAIDGVKKFMSNPNVTPQEMFESWKKFKIDQGWKYGPVKDVEAKTHPNITEYANLSPYEKKKDILFANIVRTFITR